MLNQTEKLLENHENYVKGKDGRLNEIRTFCLEKQQYLQEIRNQLQSPYNKEFSKKLLEDCLKIYKEAIKNNVNLQLSKCHQ